MEIYRQENCFDLHLLVPTCTYLCSTTPACTVLYCTPSNPQRACWGVVIWGKHLILPPCNKTPPLVNGFIKTIYGKLFEMRLEFDGTSPFQALCRVQSVQRLKLVLSPVHPSLCCPILLILFLYSWRWTDRDKNTPQGQHRLQS